MKNTMYQPAAIIYGNQKLKYQHCQVFQVFLVFLQASLLSPGSPQVEAEKGNFWNWNQLFVGVQFILRIFSKVTRRKVYLGRSDCRKCDGAQKERNHNLHYNPWVSIFLDLFIIQTSVDKFPKQIWPSSDEGIQWTLWGLNQSALVKKRVGHLLVRWPPHSTSN